jgi:hypothetical protein
MPCMIDYYYLLTLNLCCKNQVLVVNLPCLELSGKRVMHMRSDVKASSAHQQLHK